MEDEKFMPQMVEDDSTYGLSTLDALWVLIQSQNIEIQQALSNRLQRMLKAKNSKKNGIDKGLEDLRLGHIHHAENSADLMKQIFG